MQLEAGGYTRGLMRLVGLQFVIWARSLEGGGRPARERNRVDTAILCGVGRGSWEVIFCVSNRDHGVRDNIIVAVEAM